jgi:hypothetical protein
MRLMQPFAADRRTEADDSISSNNNDVFNSGSDRQAMAMAEDGGGGSSRRPSSLTSSLALTRTKANPNRAEVRWGKGKELVADDDDACDIDAVRTDDGDEDQLHVSVKTLTGKVMQVAGLRRGTTVAEVKQQLEETSGIPRHQQRLVFHGKQMADARTLAYYAVGPNDVLYMVLALRG